MSKTLAVLVIGWILVCSGCSSRDGVIDAAKAGNLARVRSIVDADPSQMYARDQNENTPAMWAILNGHNDIAIYLIGKGYPIDATSQCPFPLIMACCSRYDRSSDEMVEFLLKAGANPNAVYEKEGWTALVMAVNNEMEKKVRLLVKYGARLDQPDGSGKTPMQLARNRLAMMKDPNFHLPHGELEDPEVSKKAIDKWAAMVSLLESLEAKP